MFYFPRQLLKNPDFLQTGWSALFDKPQPLNLEIGCGYGHFLIYMAEKFPQHNFIGLDIVNKVLDKVSQRLERRNLGNAIACRLDAVLSAKEFFPEGSLDNIYILFPDPWFKDRRLKRRVLREETLPIYLSLLKTGGRFHFVTDDADYAASARAIFAGAEGIVSAEFPDIEIRTKYEEKWLKQNKEIHRFCFEKTRVCETESWSGASVLDTVALEGWSGDLNRMLFETFQPHAHIVEPYIYKLRSAYIRDDKRLLLQVILAQEGVMAQHFHLEIAPEGTLVIPETSYLPRLLNRSKVFQDLKKVLEALKTEEA